MKPKISSTCITHSDLTETHAKFLENIGLKSKMVNGALHLESTSKAFISRIKAPLKITVVDPQICLDLRVRYKTLTSSIKISLFSKIVLKLKPKELQNIAILTSGGDAPGMNTIIRSVVLSCPAKVFGVYYGFDGLIKGDFQLLTPDSVTYHSTLGGTFLKSARSKDFLLYDKRKEAVYNMNCRKIDALVAIGGDGTMKGLQALASEFEKLSDELVSENRIERKRPLSVVAIPASIDNDIGYCDITVGANTCLHRVVDSIDSLATTMTSHGRCFVIETMGRHCGWISLFSHFAVSAEYVFLPEVPHKNWELDVTRSVQNALNLGKSGCFVVVSEGALDVVGEKISSESVKNLIEEKVKCECRVLKLGHIQRGGNPSAFDRILATMLGCKAVEHIFGCGDSNPDKANTYLMNGKYNQLQKNERNGDSLGIEDISYVHGSFQSNKKMEQNNCSSNKIQILNNNEKKKSQKHNPPNHLGKKIRNSEENSSVSEIEMMRNNEKKNISIHKRIKQFKDQNYDSGKTSMLDKITTTDGSSSFNTLDGSLVTAVVATLHDQEYSIIPLEDVIAQNDKISEYQTNRDFQGLLDIRGVLFKRVYLLSEQLRLCSNDVEISAKNQVSDSSGNGILKSLDTNRMTGVEGRLKNSRSKKENVLCEGIKIKHKNHAISDSETQKSYEYLLTEISSDAKSGSKWVETGKDVRGLGGKKFDDVNSIDGNTQFTIDPKTKNSEIGNTDQEYLGILHVGQRAGGTNTALHVAVRYATSLGLKPLVVHNGFDGLLQKCFESPSSYEFSNHCHSGTPALRAGSLTADTSTILNQLRLLNITKAVVIGDKSAVRAVNELLKTMKQTNNFCCSFVVIPVCFENSLPLVSETVGADSALNFLVAACDSLRNSSTSGEAVLIAEVDENGGILTALGGIAANATAAFLPNVRYSAKHLSKLSKKLSRKKKLRQCSSENVKHENIDEGSKNFEASDDSPHNSNFLKYTYRNSNGRNIQKTRSNDTLKDHIDPLEFDQDHKNLEIRLSKQSKDNPIPMDKVDSGELHHHEEFEITKYQADENSKKLNISRKEEMINNLHTNVEHNTSNSILILKNSKSLPNITPRQLKQLITQKNIELRTCSTGDLIHGGQVSPFDRILASVCAIKAIDILTKFKSERRNKSEFIAHVLIKRGTTLQLINAECMCVEMDKKCEKKLTQIDKLHKLIE